jgi:hypothetical protein
MLYNGAVLATEINIKRNGKLIVNNEYVWIWKQDFVTHFKAFIQRVRKVTHNLNKKCRYTCPDPNESPFDYKRKSITSTTTCLVCGI